jgi:hypothetical protein
LGNEWHDVPVLPRVGVVLETSLRAGTRRVVMNQ